jgi:hypothetical protein
LPTSYAINHSRVADISKAFNATVETIDQANHNITPAKKEWLKWHFRLGHMSFRRIQLLM